MNLNVYPKNTCFIAFPFEKTIAYGYGIQLQSHVSLTRQGYFFLNIYGNQNYPIQGGENSPQSATTTPSTDASKNSLSQSPCSMFLIRCPGNQFIWTLLVWKTLSTEESGQVGIVKWSKIT
jgi:hypothetical protein